MLNNTNTVPTIIVLLCATVRAELIRLVTTDVETWNERDFAPIMAEIEDAIWALRVEATDLDIMQWETVVEAAYGYVSAQHHNLNESISRAARAERRRATMHVVA